MILPRRLLQLTFVLVLSIRDAPACKCSGIHGRTAWETAEKEAQASTAIFEGTLQRVTVQWNLLTAKPGDLVRADVRASEEWPPSRYMLFTFRVKRVYKGNLQPEVSIGTGMGGGDCGASYQPGLDYLVYAYGSRPAELWVALCSPGGWLGSNYLSTELRHLRKERPLPDDLAPVEYRTPSADARRYREGAEFKKRYTAATGQICGLVTPNALIPAARERIAFLPTAGYSPRARLEAVVSREGKFCSDRLGPGEYYVQFTLEPWNAELQLAMYYPGVVDRAKATLVKVNAGQVRSDLVFHLREPNTYTVRGWISADNKSGLGEEGVYVLLVGPDGQIWRHQPVDFRGSFPLPKVKYFVFENVLPGRYIACAFARGHGWLTRIVDVNVTSHAKLIFLEVRH